MGKLSLGSGVVWLCLLTFAACSSSESKNTAPGTEVGVCAADADCETGRRCDARLGCVACLFDADCGDGQRCEQGNCASRVTCTSSADCKSGAAAACDLKVGECFACAGDNDCKTGEKCDNHSCRSFLGCKNSLDCPSGNVCGDAKECVECASDADCAGDKTCVSAHCEARCASDKDCAGSGRLCDTSAKHCVECVSNGDCPSHYHCSTGSCERDACEEGSSRCVDSGNALESCTPPGNAWVKLFCAEHQSCESIGGQARCQSWMCTPGSTQCSTDGRRLETCSADGLGSMVSQSCGPNEACVAGACKDVLCQPNATFCRGGDVHTCNADGTAASRQMECGTDTFCDEASGTCKSRKCVPGEHRCVDGQVGTCAPDGSGFTDLKDCSKMQLCRTGACVDITCDPGAYACDANGNLTRCDADGTGSTLVASCGTDQFCQADEQVHACSADVCTGGKSSCNGSTIATCKADGSGFETATTDCAVNGQVCSGGACKPKLCEPGTRFCDGATVRVCTQQGSSSQLFDTCEANELCDTATARCVPLTCTPNAPSCKGQVAAKCKADGSGYLTAGAVDCAATKKACDAGVCKAKVCSPNATFCDKGNVQQCNALGTGSELLSTCTPEYYFCSASGNTAACSYDTCTPSTVGCSGNAVTTCRTDGSGYDLGADCGAKVCVEGACTAKVCTPNAYQCAAGNSQQCNPLGTAWVAAATCSGDTYCNATSGRCELDLCPPAAKACANEQLGTCNADGSGLGNGASTDCKATSKVCTIAGCATSATDVFGDSSNFFGSSSSALYGNVLYTHTARRLTELQQDYVGVEGTVRWLVYSSDKLAGPYAPMFDSTSTASGSGFASSGPISVQLSAGKYYFFGSLATATYFYTQPNAGTQFASFGRAIGSYGQYTKTVPVSFSFTNNTTLANIKLTTVLP